MSKAPIQLPDNVKQTIRAFETPTITVTAPPPPVPFTQPKRTTRKDRRRRPRWPSRACRLGQEERPRTSPGRYLTVNLNAINAVPDPFLKDCLKQYARRVALMLRPIPNNSSDPTPLTCFAPQTPSISCHSNVQARYVSAKMKLSWCQQPQKTGSVTDVFDTGAVQSIGRFLVSLIRDSCADPMNPLLSHLLDIHRLRLHVTKGRQYVQTDFDMVTGKVTGNRRGVVLKHSRPSPALPIYSVTLTLRKRHKQRRLKRRRSSLRDSPQSDALTVPPTRSMEAERPHKRMRTQSPPRCNTSV